MYKLVFYILIVFLLPFQADAQKSKSGKKAKPAATAIDYNNLPPGVTKGATVEGITEYFLPNGLQFLLFPDPSKQTITVNITYKVGSRHEGYGETGMAHLLEHLVFKGTPRHPDIPNELTKHGARPNGTTWYDRTNYFETFSATDENLRWALDLEADRMVNSFIAKKHLDSEMTVVRNEFESGENDPSGILMERVLSTAYLWHNYGKSTIGARADIENVPIERLQAFYRKYYQPDNAVLMVAGKIDEKKTVWWVHEFFSKIPKPKRELIETYTAEPTQDGERHVTLKRVGDVQVVSCMYHIPPGSHPDAAAADILVDVMTMEPSGRLYKALVETKKASSQFGWCATLKEPGFVYFGAQVRKENNVHEVRDLMMATLDDIAKNPPTKEEVERARNKQIKDIELFTRNTEFVGRTISEYIGMGDWRLAFIYRDNIRKVTPEDVQRVALSYFKPANRTSGLFIPEEKPDRAEIPKAPNVAALVKNYKGDQALAQGEEFDPSCANIEQRTKRGVEAQGLKYAFLQKKTKGNLVNANMTLRFGDENSLKGKATISEFTARMLNRGTTTKSWQEIKDQFDKLKARVNFFGSGGSVSANIQTTRENLPAALQLVTEIFRQPVFNEKEFEEMKNEELAGIEEQRSDPQALVSNAVQRHLNPYPKGDVRYVKTMEEEMEDIKAVKIEDLKMFYQDFYGADHSSFSVVGDFDENEVKKVVTEGLANWKSKNPYKRIADNYLEVPATNQNIETPDKANAMFLAGMNLNIRDDDPDYPALVLGNYILGGGFLNSRLATRIRQKEGLSYGVGSQLFADAQDKSGGFMAYAIYAPENRDKLETAFKEEIARMLKDGFTQQEVDDARSGLLQSRKVSRSQDNQLSGQLNSMLNINRTFKFSEEMEQKISQLTPQQIHTALNKHIDINKISYFKGGDFANKLSKP
ncbi:MAG: insulinase family protein [Saprospiraceae bacterium]|nr:insulinase family protein [Saprospiraceae bacterium]